MASAYSIRPTPDARVSAPLSWDEVPDVDPRDFTLATMPAEARLTIRYGDMDVFGLDESFLTLSRLDAATNTWFSVPNVVIDPVSNYLETPLMETGVYVLSVP